MKKEESKMEKGNSNISSWGGKRIPIFFTFDDGYAAQAGVTFKSLLENKYPHIMYDLYVITDKINSENEQKLKSIVNEYKNNTLTFINGANYSDITGRFKAINKYKLHPEVCLYRLIVSKIKEFEKYDKIIYSDVDILVKKDISALYDITLNYEYVAAVRHPKFMENFLTHIKDEYIRKNYIFSGMLVMNLKKQREDNFVQKIYEIAFNEKYDIKFIDQDILNYACNNKIKYISLKYVGLHDITKEIIDKIDYKKEYYSYEEFIETIYEMNIIHYIGETVPWKENYFDINKQLEWFYWLNKTTYKNEYKDVYENTIKYEKEKRYLYQIYLFWFIPICKVQLKGLKERKIKIKLFKLIPIIKIKHKDK